MDANRTLPTETLHTLSSGKVIAVIGNCGRYINDANWDRETKADRDEFAAIVTANMEAK